jgi:hypothetical protein
VSVEIEAAIDFAATRASYGASKVVHADGVAKATHGAAAKATSLLSCRRLHARCQQGTCEDHQYSFHGRLSVVWKVSPCATLTG